MCALEKSMVRRAIALGTFDGVHTGHRQLLDSMMSISAQRGLQPTIYTFSNHPLEAFGKAPKRIMKDEDRLNRLRETAPVAAEPFTLELAAMPPEEFARRMAEEFGMAVAVAGFNYTFGQGGAGDIAALRRYGEKYGFEVCEIQPTMYKGFPVSSTRIRQRLEAGDVRGVNAMLGREFTLSGEAMTNKRIEKSARGHHMADIPLEEGIAHPAPGTYATCALLHGREWPAVTSICRNPVADGRKYFCKTHIAGLEASIYAERLTVCFVERLSEESFFGPAEERSALRKSVWWNIDKQTASH